MSHCEYCQPNWPKNRLGLHTEPGSNPSQPQRCYRCCDDHYVLVYEIQNRQHLIVDPDTSEIVWAMFANSPHDKKGKAVVKLDELNWQYAASVQS